MNLRLVHSQTHHATGALLQAQNAAHAEMQDLFTTRALLEEQAARVAARGLSDDDIAKIQRMGERLERCLPGGRLDEAEGLLRSLHFRIYRASERSHLLRLIEDLWERSSVCAADSHMLTSRPDDDLYVVRALASSCKLRDGHSLGMMVRYKLHQVATHHLGRPLVSDTRAVESRFQTRFPA